jgi:hypothetical protein
MGRSPCGAVAAIALHDLLTRSMRSVEGLAVLEQAVRLHPGERKLASRLFAHHLERGDVAAAGAALRVHPATDLQRQTVALLETGPDRAAPFDPLGVGSSHTRLLLGRMELVRRLRQGDVAGAERLLAGISRSDTYVRAWDRMSLDLLAAGSVQGWVARIAQQSLRADPAHWIHAALALGTDAGVAWFDRLAGGTGAAAGAAPGEAVAERAIAAALLASRRGEWERALATLARARRLATGVDPFPAAVCEVLARPLWRSALGVSAPVEILDRARRDPGPRNGPAPAAAIAAYWKCVRDADHTAAAGHAARLFEDRPRELFWGVSALWGARIARDAAAEQRWRRRLEARLWLDGVDPGWLGFLDVEDPRRTGARQSPRAVTRRGAP